MGIRAIGYLDIRLEGQLDQPGIWRYLRVWRYLGVWRMEIPGGMETGMSQSSSYGDPTRLRLRVRGLRLRAQFTQA